MSHSHFLGGPDRWTELDRAKAREYAAWAAALCPGCQTAADEWDPKAGGHRHAYLPETHRCPGCEVKEQERELVPDGAKGVYVYLTPNLELLQED